MGALPRQAYSSTPVALAADLASGAGVAELMARAGDADILVNNLSIFGEQRFERIARAVAWQSAEVAFRDAAGRTPVRVYFERGGQLGYTDFYVR